LKTWQHTVVTRPKPGEWTKSLRMEIFSSSLKMYRCWKCRFRFWIFIQKCVKRCNENDDKWRKKK